MEIANRTIYQFPFKLPKNLVLYLRMFSILEGVCLALDPNFRFIHILRALLEEEGLVDEAYRKDIQGVIDKVAKALDASIEVAPMLKQFLEEYQLREKTPVRGRGRQFFAGLVAGLGVAGFSVSLYLFDTSIGKIGLAVSAVLLAASAIASR
jgi:predicted unusual protein kinase regulating ubiquinone biosynthesis (AarF/ABC1/UbiB family)